MSSILYFGATWCGPCKAVKAVLADLEEEEWGVEVEFYDIEAFPLISKQYGIRSVPTLIKVDEHLEVIDSKVGMQTKKILKAWMED